MFLTKYHAKATWTALLDWSFAMRALQYLPLVPWSTGQQRFVWSKSDTLTFATSKGVFTWTITWRNWTIKIALNKMILTSKRPFWYSSARPRAFAQFVQWLTRPCSKVVNVHPTFTYPASCTANVSVVTRRKN